MGTEENTTSTETGNMVVGQVAILYGNVKAISPDGTERVLTVNSPVYAYDRIITESDGMVSIIIDDTGAQVDLGRMSDMVIDADVFAGVTTDEAADAAAEVQHIQELLLTEGYDPTTELEAPAAGGPVSAGGGHPVADFERVTHEGEVTSGAETTGITTDTVEPITGVVEESTSPEAIADQNDAVEGGEALTGNVIENDIANDSSLNVISVEVGGETHDIPEGGSIIVNTPLGGSLIIESNGDYEYTPPAYVDHTETEGAPVTEEFSYTVINSNGDTDSSTLTVAVGDTEPAAVPDFDTVEEDTILTAQGNVITDAEGDGGQDDLGADPAEITRVNGVAVVADTTSDDGTEIAGDYGTLIIGADGSYVYTLNNDSSVVQGLSEGDTLTDSFQYTLTDIDGDSSTASLNILISGTNDLAVVTFDDVDVFEGSETATITATIDNVPQGNDLILFLSNGATLTIAEGENTGTSTPFAIQGDDPYLDGESYTVSVTDFSGGFLDDINTSDTAAVTISDTIDTTYLTLDDVTVDEGAGTATVTASLTNPTDTAMTVTLSNGATIDFAAGADTATSTPFAIQGDDPYLDGESYTVSVAGTSGGNFEDLDTSDTAAVTISDTIDTTYLTLDDVTVDEGAGTATVAASLTNPTDIAMIVTLSNDATIYFAAGADTATSTPFVIQGDDPYLDGESYTVSVAGTIGGNFENLDTSDTATININDTIDTTYLTLDATSPVIEGGDITYTATVDNAPQGDLVITLDDAGNTQITIPNGQTSGQVTVTAQDVSDGGETMTVGVASTSGGNYEALDTTDTTDVSITDNDPTGGITYATIDDEGLDGIPGGDGDVVVTPDPDNDESTFSGNLPHDFGYDGAGSIDFASMDGKTGTVGTETVNYSWDASFNTLTATVAAGEERAGTDLFTVTVDNPLTGAYTVNLINNVLHESLDNGAGDNTENDAGPTALTYTVTDSDGSSVPGTLNITFDDDIPAMDSVNIAIPNLENTYSGIYTFDVGADTQPFAASIGEGSLIWNGAPEGWNLTLDAARSSATSQVYVTTYNDAPTDFFTISINEDGTYDFTLDDPKPVTVSDPTNILQGIDGGSGLASYTFDSSVFGGYFNLVVTGETDNGSDTLTISATDLGVADNVVQESKGDTLIFQMNPEDGFEDSVTITKLTVSIADSASIRDGVDVHMQFAYTDGTVVDSYQPYYKAAGGDIAFELDDTKTLDYFTLSNDETDGKNYSFKIDGISLEYQITTYPDDYQLDFTLSGTDADNDTVSTDFSVMVSTADVDGHYEINGSATADIIYGTPGDDTIHGDAGDDIIYGGDGEDQLFGGAGSDIYHANDGFHDTIGNGVSDDLSMSDLDNLDTLVVDPDDTGLV